mmetsp:Transcript_70811/g.166173  ORF Transcript_70811/g.166173 Transcript_70811/m.166173 type:complete len:295 (+) Transcript_70811:2447-3331(+)
MELNISPCDGRRGLHGLPHAADLQLVPCVEVQGLGADHTEREDDKCLALVDAEGRSTISVHSHILVEIDVEAGLCVLEAHEIALDVQLGLRAQAHFKLLCENHVHRRPDGRIQQQPLQLLVEARLGVVHENRLHCAVGAATKRQEAAERPLVVELHLELEARLHFYRQVGHTMLNGWEPFDFVKFRQKAEKRKTFQDFRRQLVGRNSQICCACRVQHRFQATLNNAMSFKTGLPFDVRRVHKFCKLRSEVEEACCMCLDVRILQHERTLGIWAVNGERWLLGVVHVEIPVPAKV